MSNTTSLDNGNSTIRITGPDVIEYCKDATITFTGGAGPPYTYVAYPNGPNYWQQGGNRQNFTIWNWLVGPRWEFHVFVSDKDGNGAFKYYTIAGDTVNPPPCPTVNPNPDPNAWYLHPQGIVQYLDTPCRYGLPCPSKQLPSRAVAGIIIGAITVTIAIIVGLCIFWRKKKGPRRLVNSGEAKGYNSGSAADQHLKNVWMDFGGKDSSLESISEKRESTYQVVERFPSPTAPDQTTRARDGGYPNEKGRLPARRSIASSGTHPSLNTFSEDIFYSDSTNPPTNRDSVQSPFSDVHGAVMAAWSDMKLSPISNPAVSEMDARQLSTTELEAIADMVTARLRQRTTRSSAQPSRSSHGISEELPRYA